MICSDGLTDLVWNDEIAEIIRAKSSLKAAAQELIDTANQRGGHDNTTIVLINVPRDLKLTVPKRPKWWPWVIGSGIALLLFLAIASFLVINLLRTTLFANPTPTFTASSIPTETLTETPTVPPTPTETLPATPTLIEPTYTPWPTNTEVLSGTPPTP